MERLEKTIRFGAAVIAGAVLLRLLGGGMADRLFRWVTSGEVTSMLLFLETGRVVRTDSGETTGGNTDPTTQTEPGQTLPPDEHQTDRQPQAVFGPDDANLVEVNSVCGYEADVEGGLVQALSWDLTVQGPTVLIIHSHGTESYMPTGEYEESSAYRTQNNAYNVVSIGDRLVQVLEKGGVRAVHDRQLHDSPSYSNSYVNARSSIQAYLEQYPTIQLVLDIHRDAVATSNGTQMSFTTDVEGTATAQLMLVVGTDAAGLSHPGWPENMSLAVKLHAQLEKMAPGICRPISFRSQRFNQDLSPGALIVEVGAAGNSREEALAAVELLGQAILELACGSTTREE